MVYIAVGNGEAGKAMALPLSIYTLLVLWTIMWMSLTNFDKQRQWPYYFLGMFSFVLYYP